MLRWNEIKSKGLAVLLTAVMILNLGISPVTVLANQSGAVQKNGVEAGSTEAGADVGGGGYNFKLRREQRIWRF